MIKTYEFFTVPNSYPVSISGVNNEEKAKRLCYIIGEHIKNISKFLDMSQLDSVVISNDLDSALLSIDRGVGTLPPLSRTNDEYAECVAKVVHVVRNKINKYCLVLHAEVFAPLEHYEDTFKENDSFNNAFNLLIHECAHVSLYTHFNKIFPNKKFHEVESYEDSILLAPMLVVLDEYVANRTASSIYDAQSMYIDTAKALAQTLETIHEDCEKGFERFYVHKNVKMFYEDVASRAFMPIRFYAYHLGNMDGAELNWEHFPELKKTIHNDVIFLEILNELTLELRKLWDTFDNWKSFEVFYPLKKISLKLYTKMEIPMFF